MPTKFYYPAPGESNVFAGIDSFGLDVDGQKDALGLALVVGGKVGIGPDLKSESTYASDAPSLSVSTNASIGYVLTSTNAKYPTVPPTLAVKGKVGIGYDWSQVAGVPEYLESSPELAVASKVGIGYTLTNTSLGAYDSNAPALSVRTKVAVGFDFVHNGPGNYPEEAPELNINGKVAINTGFSYATGDGSPHLNVSGISSVHGSMNVSRVGSLTHYPILTAVNGLLGQIETPTQIDVSTDVQQKIHDTVDATFGGRHILMGNLERLLPPKPLLPTGAKPPNPYNQPYGIHMKDDDWFATFNLVNVPKHKPKILTYKPYTVKPSWPKPQNGTPTDPIPERRDAVLSWGSHHQSTANETRWRNYLRIRYVSDKEISVLLKELSGKPMSRAQYNKLSEAQKDKLEKKRQSRYERLQKKISGALADPGEEITSPAPGEDEDHDLDTRNYRDIVVSDPDGSVVVNGAIYSYRTSKISDGRLKEAVAPIDCAIGKIMALEGVSFAWKTGEEPQGDDRHREYGLIAQDVERVCPEAVSKSEDEVLAVDYEQLTPILIEALKDQQRTIDSQRERLDRVERALQELASKRSKSPARRPDTRSAVTAEPRKKAPAPPRPPAKRSAAPRTGRAARGPRQ